MGVWSNPLDDEGVSKAFIKLMQKPIYDKQKIYDYVGCDELWDNFFDVPDGTDLRPMIKAHVLGWIKAGGFESSYPEAMEIVYMGLNHLKES